MGHPRLIIALAAALLAAALPASANATQRAYFGGAALAGPAVAGFELGAAGTLVPVGSAAAGPEPLRGAAISPGGENLYAASAGGGLRAFELTPGGAPAPIAVPPSAAALQAVTVTPDGRFIYAVGPGGGGGVYAWARDADGSVRPIDPGISYVGAASIAVAPDGSYLFIASTHYDNVRPFAIGDDGRLTLRGPTAAGTDPVATAISPDGRFLYIGGSSGVRTFSIGSGGTLDQADSQPGPADALLVSPDGRVLYAADGGAGEIRRLPLGADGVPGASLGPITATGAPAALAADAAGGRLYAHDSAARRAFGFALDGSGAPGALAGSPFDVLVSGSIGGSVAITPEQPPVAAFTTKVNNRRVSFDARTSADPGGDQIARYDWEFSDGTRVRDGGAQITRRFGGKRPKATLTVSDAAGCSTDYVSDGHTPYCNGSGKARRTLKPFQPRYLGDRHQRVGAAVRLRLRCPVDCRVKVVGRLKLSGRGVAAKQVHLRSAAASLRAGRAGTLKLRLPPRGARLAAAATRAVARLEVSARDDAGDLFKERHGISLR